MKKTNDTPMEDFQALYNRQVNRVYRLALVMLGSQSDAEDMVQMVFLKVWEKKISFRDTDQTIWKMLCGWHWSRWNQNTGFCCICIIMKAIPYGN